ncbi:HPF/RaiA family ribosome-associated protein, partial [Chlamydia ibidis]
MQRSCRPHKQTKRNKFCQGPVEITGKSFQISQPLKKLIFNKSNQLPVSDAIHVVFTPQKNKHSIETHVVVVIGKDTFQAKTIHENPYTAVISSFKKIRNMINKRQKTRIDKKKRGVSLPKEAEEAFPFDQKPPAFYENLL